MLYQNVSRLNNIFLFLASLHSSLKMSRSVDMISLRWSSIFMINRSPASSSIIFSLIAIMIIIISHAIDIIDNFNNIGHHRHNYSQVLNHFLNCLFRISLDHIRRFLFHADQVSCLNNTMTRGKYFVSTIHERRFFS